MSAWELAYGDTINVKGTHTNRDGVNIGVGRLELNHVNCSHFDERMQDWLVKLLKDFLDVVVVEDQKSFVEVSLFFSVCGRFEGRKQLGMGSGFK